LKYSNAMMTEAADTNNITHTYFEYNN
jgi:hypothetical protein